MKRRKSGMTRRGDGTKRQKPPGPMISQSYVAHQILSPDQADDQGGRRMGRDSQTESPFQKCGSSRLGPADARLDSRFLDGPPAKSTRHCLYWSRAVKPPRVPNQRTPLKIQRTCGC